VQQALIALSTDAEGRGMLLLVVLFVSTAIAIFFSYQTLHAIERPLTRLVTAANQFGAGDLTVAAYEPGRRLRFEFEPGPFSSGLLGYHEFTVLDDGPAGATLRHLIAARALGAKRLAWPLVIRPLHDALLEDLLDRAERAASGRDTGSRGWSPWVRLLRWMLARRGRRRAG